MKESDIKFITKLNFSKLIKNESLLKSHRESKDKTVWLVVSIYQSYQEDKKNPDTSIPLSPCTSRKEKKREKTISLASHSSC